jgi:hypothetical protein
MFRRSLIAVVSLAALLCFALGAPQVATAQSSSPSSLCQSAQASFGGFVIGFAFASDRTAESGKYLSNAQKQILRQNIIQSHNSLQDAMLLVAQQYLIQAKNDEVSCITSAYVNAVESMQAARDAALAKLGGSS